MWQHPNGDVWSASIAPGEERIGIFRRTSSGNYRLDEDMVRPLTGFEIERFEAGENGTTILTGLDGAIIFDPHAKPPARRPFSALVRSVLTSSGDVLFGGDTGTTSELRLNYQRNSLRFDFAAPVFGNASQTLYQYFLEGADKGWSAWDTRTQANYNDLGPGAYRLHVRARSVEGKLSEETAYPFLILPPGTAPKLHTRSMRCCCC